jgi:hypothetical protein
VDAQVEHNGQRKAVRVIIIIIHLLGLAPAGYLAAPDSGPRAAVRVILGATQDAFERQLERELKLTRGKFSFEEFEGHR